MTMSLASITSQERQYRRVVEDAATKGANLALEKVPMDKDELQRVLEQGDKFGSAIADAIIAATRKLSAGKLVVSTAASVEAPANLAELLERQVARLLGIGAAAEAKVAKGKYRDEIMAAVAAFSWRGDRAAIDLNRLALVDFRLRDHFLAEASGVNEYIAADECTLYEGVAEPDGLLVVQGQWGVKYRKKSPRWCRINFHPLEQGLTVKERLTVHLFEGDVILRECYADCPGSVSPDGGVPCLRLWFDRPEMSDSSDCRANPSYGSGSRGK